MLQKLTACLHKTRADSKDDGTSASVWVRQNDMRWMGTPIGLLIGQAHPKLTCDKMTVVNHCSKLKRPRIEDQHVSPKKKPTVDTSMEMDRIPELQSLVEIW